MKLLLLQLLITAVALTTLATAYRLPTTVIPSQYRIHLNLSEATFTANSDDYHGHVIISLRANGTGVNQIQLHAAHDFINITTAFINSVEITNISVDNSTDIVTLGFNGFLSQTANSTLHIYFNSRLSTQDMYGFYKSSYTSNNAVRYLATTQFQPNYARRAFPCFDEPSFKATFEIYITHPARLHALSNMPEQEYDTTDIIDDDPNLNTTYFAPTNLMPTYLVAFIVSDFTCTQGENIEQNAVPYRVCSRAETNLTRAFAVNSGVPLLRSLNTLTGYAYSTMGFPKMDQIALPDFAAGAMENWGLVTYRETLLLWDSAQSTNRDQQNIATVISHEYAHQWWGNLVTCNWWSELFLNEGFATYFEYFTTHDVFPDWQLDKQWVVRVMQNVMEADSLSTSQALQTAVNSDAQVMARFNSISYHKGGSIFRMVEHILGTDLFFQGLRAYLSTYAFSTAVPDDLWNSLDAQLIDANRSRLPAGVTLSTVMRNWVETPGYPIIDVQNNQYEVIVSQNGRFLLNGSNDSAAWYIPISYATNENPTFEDTAAKEWLEPVGFLNIPFLTARWIVLNNHATSYYRVNYNNLWDSLIVALQDGNFSGIPEVNRAAFVDDSFHLARANMLNYTKVFSIIDFLKNDTSHYPWLPAIRGFNFLLLRIGQDSRLGQAMSRHILELLTNIYASVPWINLNPGNHPYTLKQVDILAIACRLGMTNCRNHALERFGDLIIGGVRPTPNLRSVVYCNGLRYSNNSNGWWTLWDMYHFTDLASERVGILSALGCTRDETLLKYYLELSLYENTGIRPQDALSVFTSVYTGSSVGLKVAFKFLQENHVRIGERYQSLNALTNIITGLADRFTTEEELIELRRFITTGNLQEDFLSAANAALLRAEANLLWISQHSEELYQYYGLDIEEPVPETSTSSSTEPPPPPPTTTPVTTAAPSSASALTASFILLVVSICVSY
ncbi:unnamed protein product [Ceutorhynchus assimilis]|uniref:Aminopeptidase n=1 Tax=Ceutorhynchus assimilis TaxID=467358 RepID=A0A9N9MVL2_9CUCU|nr:unnamed protein product [Ceutorhynchus assimilis]